MVPLELAREGESGRGTSEGETLEVTTFVGEAFVGVGKGQDAYLLVHTGTQLTNLPNCEQGTCYTVF